MTHIKGTRGAACEGAVMPALADSLHAQHVEIDRLLQSVMGAARSSAWPSYRLYFSILEAGLRQHMAFEEEALFPGLEARAAAAVRDLREEHAKAMRHLETLGAAAPEHDPEGCLAELDQLAELLRTHHEAEMALDPGYSSRPIPPLVSSEPRTMDLRGLQPPEPIVRIFQALERAPDAPLRVILPHEPVPLYTLLRDRGFGYSGRQRADGGYELLIGRS